MKDIYNATAGTAELRKKVLKYSAPIAAQTGKKKKKNRAHTFHSHSSVRSAHLQKRPKFEGKQ